MFETGQHIALAFAGPVLPTDKSLILLLGDGYIAGYFFGSIFLPDVADLQGSISIADRDAEVEIWRRRWGIAVSFILAAVWVAGNIKASSSYPIAPADHDLFGAIPMVGIGALAGSLYAPWISKWLIKNSQRARTRTRLDLEHRMGEHFERVFGVAFATLYVGVWLKPW